jgi:hypothetical protein
MEGLGEWEKGRSRAPYEYFCVERSSDQFQAHFRRDTPRRAAAKAMILERQYRTCMVITEERTSFHLSPLAGGK